MMRLAEFRAGVPVFVVHSEVAYLTPRVPTAFEKMVLRLVERAADHPAIGSISLSAAFGEFLDVADAPRLLQPCLDELQALEVLMPPGSDEPLQAPLSAWRLTDQGRDFWRRGLLPLRPRHETVEHVYDAVADDFAPLNEGISSSDAPALRLDATVPDTDFGPLVRAALLRQKPAWLKVTTEIRDVQAAVVDTRWRTVVLQLDLATDGTLQLRAAHDQVFDRWLRQAQPEVVWERLISPLLGGALPRSHGLPSVALAAASSVEPLETSMDQAVRSGPVLVVHANDELQPQLGPGPVDRVILRDSPGLLSFLMRHRAEPDSADAPDGGVTLRLLKQPNLPEGLQRIEIRRPGAAPQAVVEAVATLYWAGQERLVLLRAGLSAAASQAAWAALCLPLESWLAGSAAPHQLALAAWFEPPEAVVTRWLGRATHLPALEWLDALTRFLAGLQSRLGLQERVLDAQSWAAPLREAITEVVDRESPGIPLGRAIELLQAMRRVSLRQDRAVRALLERIEPQDAMASLQRLRQALADDTLDLPARLLGEPVRRELLRAALRDDVRPACGAHALVPTLQTFAHAYQKARREVPAVLLDQPVASTAEWHQALRKQPARTLKAVIALQQAMAEVLGALELSGEVLAAPAARLKALRQAMDAMLAPALPEGQRAVVIDTNALLDMPDLLERMPSQDRPVVARCVIEELDGLKQSQSSDPPEKQMRAQLARRASRAIQNAADAERIIFEGSRREQCAADLQPTPDNEILAVAAYYALSQVLLLSGDRNLCLKARGEGLAATAPAQYLQPIRNTSAPARPARNRSPVR